MAEAILLDVVMVWVVHQFGNRRGNPALEHVCRHVLHLAVAQARQVVGQVVPDSIIRPIVGFTLATVAEAAHILAPLGRGLVWVDVQQRLPPMAAQAQGEDADVDRFQLLEHFLRLHLFKSSNKFLRQAAKSANAWPAMVQINVPLPTLGALRNTRSVNSSSQTNSTAMPPNTPKLIIAWAGRSSTGLFTIFISRLRESSL